MSLRAKNQKADTKNEDQTQETTADENAASAAEETASTAKTGTSAPDTDKTDTKAVAKKEIAPPPAVPVGMEKIFLANPDLVEVVSTAEFGDFASIVGAEGNHMLKKGQSKVPLGDTLEFQVISARKTWKVSTGSNDEEAKKFFKVSYDGETCADGSSLEATVEEAHADGYENTYVAKGIDIGAWIMKCEKDPDQVHEVRILSLSPTSSRNWTPVEKSVKVKAIMGKLTTVPMVEGSEDEAVVFRSKAVLMTNKANNTYTAFEFEVV